MGYRYSIKQMSDARTNNDWLTKVLKEEFFPNQNVQVLSDQYGKPILKEPPGYFISTSDSGGLVAVVVHYKPIGIDVEHLRERIPELLLNTTGAAERLSLEVLGKDAVLAAWTAKEAAQKSDSRIHDMKDYILSVKDNNPKEFVVRRGSMAWQGIWSIERDYICALAFRD